MPDQMRLGEQPDEVERLRNAVRELCDKWDEQDLCAAWDTLFGDGIRAMDKAVAKARKAVGK